MRCVSGMVDPVFNTTLLDEWPEMAANTRGSYVGTAFQMKMTKWLNVIQPGSWRKGEASEPDIVCLYNNDWSFEVKTSCNRGVTILGNRVQATADKPPCFLLYVNYNRDALTIRDVRMGWCGPTDWVPGGATSQSARLSTESRNQFFSLPEGGGINLLAQAAGL
jgi:hypothetical protein